MGWDLGGAHMKVALADRSGRLHRLDQIYTPLWRGLEHLDMAMAQVEERFPVREARHRLTMTGELTDLFQSRDQGVAALTARMQGHLAGRDLRVYAGPHGFIPSHLAANEGRFVASANWHASAALVACKCHAALLVDLGSTTTDLVPVARGAVRNRGYSDRERMGVEELIYSGVVRTPVMSFADRVPLDGEWTGLAAEQFATAADVYRLTGELPSHADLGDTADGRGKSQAESASRLARMVGLDAGSREPEAWRALARYLSSRQLERIGQACARQCSSGIHADAPLVGAGVGRFLVGRLAQRLERPYLDINDLFAWDTKPTGADAGDCAPAAAVALLGAREE